MRTKKLFTRAQIQNIFLIGFLELPLFALLNDSQKIPLRSRKTREYPIQRLRAHVIRNDLGEHRPEISRQSKIPPFVKLFRFKTRPATVNFPSLHVPSDDKQRAGVPVP